MSFVPRALTVKSSRLKKLNKKQSENNQLILDLTNGCYGFQSKKYNLRRIE